MNISVEKAIEFARIHASTGGPESITALLTLADEVERMQTQFKAFGELSEYLCDHQIDAEYVLDLVKEFRSAARCLVEKIRSSRKADNV